MANQDTLTSSKQEDEMWNKWREKRPEIVPDQSRTDVSRCNFRKINLSSADLCNANLFETNLSEVDLSTPTARLLNLAS
ncbi:hypothetical protein KSF_088380 [Reticulibacter mediterranei]|uniref:Pentapeptide repeat-containing protein n=1 Tax=Reticulibacter mediterranei TaxID=2778369 RepID=A0A8J3IXV8_9CHLR|nr:pentapeptide repeat-containing protein [Reticulibacter mediterranei]GHO98790.1 hypothetical protein KSF_088380 [Reticulibacter mediterranei]